MEQWHNGQSKFVQDILHYNVNCELKCFKHAITGRVHCYMLGAEPTIFNFPAHLQRTAVHQKPPKKRTAIVLGSRRSTGSTSSTRNRVHYHAYDHSYCMQSPTKLKRKLTGVVSALESAKKKNKNSTPV